MLQVKGETRATSPGGPVLAPLPFTAMFHAGHRALGAEEGKVWEWGAPGHNQASQAELSLLVVLEVLTTDNPHQPRCLQTLSLPVEKLSTCWAQQSLPNLCPPSRGKKKGWRQMGLETGSHRNVVLRELHREVWLTGTESHKMNDRCVLRH